MDHRTLATALLAAALSLPGCGGSSVGETKVFITTLNAFEPTEPIATLMRMIAELNVTPTHFQCGNADGAKLPFLERTINIPEIIPMAVFITVSPKDYDKLKSSLALQQVAITYEDWVRANSDPFDCDPVAYFGLQPG